MKMFKANKARILLLLLLIALLAASGFIGFQIFAFSPKTAYLKVAFLDVGQGDSIFIEAPNGNQVLIDGGPDKKVLAELDKLMPLGDRSLDLIVATHSDKDHVGGLIPVLENYEVAAVLETGLWSETQTAELLKKAIAEEKSSDIIARASQIIWLDKKRNIYLKVLSPARLSRDTNESSIVTALVYGQNSFLFPADAPAEVEDSLVDTFGHQIDADILKLAHHGSRYSSSEKFLAAVSPSVAIISAGKKNPYGHPHPETLARLRQLKIPFLGTYDLGTIVFESDGKTINRLE